MMQYSDDSMFSIMQMVWLAFAVNIFALLCEVQSISKLGT